MYKTIGQLLAISTLLLFVQACDQLSSSFDIVAPENNKTYIGTDTQAPPIPDVTMAKLPVMFEVAYETPPTTDVDIILNGHKIGQYFSYGPTKALGDISKFKQFFRHGKNTLSVDPMGFGPVIIFNYDAEGPDVIITRGEVAANGNSVEIEGKLRDFSSVSSILEVDLTQISDYQADGSPTRTARGTVNIAVNPDGTFCACGSSAVNIAGLIVSDNPGTPLVNEQKSLLYSFRATDRYGYLSTVEFLADTAGGDALPIEAAIRVAVGDSFIESLRPIIASALYTSMQQAPIDIRENPWENPNLDGNDNCPDTATPNDGNSCWSDDGNDGLIVAGGVNPLKVDIGLGNMPTTLERIYLASNGTILLNGLKLKENNLMDIDLAITEMLAELNIDGGWFLGNIPIGVNMERLVINGDINVQAIDKKMTVNFQDNASFTVQGMTFTKLEIFGIPIAGLGNLIAPVIEGLIGDMLPGILNPIFEDNLEKFIIGGRLTQPESGSEFDMLMNIAQMGTDNILGPNNPYDLMIEMESIANLITPDDHVKPALGAIYYDDPIDRRDTYNSLAETGTNLTVAVSSNMINQVLASLYSVGVSHFTLYNGTTYYGANPLTPESATTPGQTSATNGQTRVRLWPDMPPRLDFAAMQGGAGGGTASITYDSATLYMDKVVNGVWQTDVSLNVTFDLGITINEEAGVVQLGSAGPPTFTILSMQNNSNIQIPQALIQGVLDAALFIGGDILADRKFSLDMNALVAGTLSGTEVKFLSDQDDYTIASNNPNACIAFDESGAVELPLKSGVSAGGDGNYDLVCEVIDFVASTNTVGVTGSKGSNLFFQMEARDPSIPPAPALPRFDLDDDSIVDYKDNCSVPNGDLAEAIQSVLDDTGNSFSAPLASNIYNKGDTYPVGHPDAGQVVRVTDYGKPVPGFENAIRAELNTMYATRKGGGANPVAADITHYNNMRTGDPYITTGNWGSYPWLRVLFSNPAQINQDGPNGEDRIGDLCESDDDRDGIWASYDDGALDDDNCPYKYNPGQEDTQFPSGVGDACNARTTYILLRSLESAIEGGGGTPRCLTRAGLTGTNWVSDTLKNMAPCNAADTNQHWFMKAVNPNDMDAGVEFYDNTSRSSNTNYRLTTYGKAETWDYGNKQTRVDEMRLLRANNSVLNAENGDSVSACTVWPCNRSADRADPVFYLTAAAPSNDYTENTHPWYIKTNFNYNFANSGWSNIGANSCMTYSTGWGVDIGSSGDPEFCSTGARWRWAIWVGGTDSPWNGVW